VARRVSSRSTQRCLEDVGCCHLEEKGEAQGGERQERLTVASELFGERDTGSDA
jgi:hypothetical protein